MFDRFRRVLRRGAVAVASPRWCRRPRRVCRRRTPDKQQNALRPKGHAARKILDLTTPFFWIAVVIGIGVVGATVFVAIRFREKPGEERNPKQIHGNSDARDHVDDHSRAHPRW